MSNIVFYDNEQCCFGEITSDLFYSYGWIDDPRYIKLETYDPVVDPKGFYEIRNENENNPNLKKSWLEKMFRNKIGV